MATWPTRGPLIGLLGGGKLGFGREFCGWQFGFLSAGNGPDLSFGALAGLGLGGFGSQSFGLSLGFSLVGGGGLPGGSGGFGSGGFFPGSFGHSGGSSFSRSQLFGFGEGGSFKHWCSLFIRITSFKWDGEEKLSPIPAVGQNIDCHHRL